MGGIGRYNVEDTKTNRKKVLKKQKINQLTLSLLFPDQKAL